MPGKATGASSALSVDDNAHNWNPRADRAFGEGGDAWTGDYVNSPKSSNRTAPAGVLSHTVLWGGNRGDGTLVDASGFTEDDTTVYRFGEKRSTKFAATTGAGNNAQLTINIPAQGWPDPVWLSIYADENTLHTSGPGCTIYCAKDQNLGSGDTRHSYIFQARQMVPGWNLIPIFQDDWSNLTAPDNFTGDFESFRIRIDSNAGGPQQFWFDAWLSDIQSLPQAVITVDDGFDDCVDMANYANPRGVPLTLYPIPDLIGNANYLTAAELASLAKANEVGLHDFNSGTNWPDVGTEDEILARLLLQKEATEAIVGSKVRTASYPQGDYGDAAIGATSDFAKTRNALARAGIVAARATALPSVKYQVPIATNPYLIRAFPLNDTVTLAEAQAEVDAAIAAGSLVVFYGHKLGTPDSLTWATADFEDLVDYIQTAQEAGNIKAVTLSQAMQNLADIDPDAAAWSAGFHSAGKFEQR